MIELEPHIAELANRLGQAITESPVARKYHRARAEALADQDAQALLKAQEEHLNLLARKERDKRPIEVDDKHKLRELQQKLSANEKIKALLAAQADYVELTQRVTDLLSRYLLGAEQAGAKVQPA